MTKKWIQKARKRMEKKGTVGSFTRYCGGKVTDECIRKALKSKDPKIRKKAAFAKAMRSIKRKKEYGGHLDEFTMADTTYALGGELAGAGLGIVLDVMKGIVDKVIQKNRAINQFDSSLNAISEFRNGGYIEGTKDTYIYKGPDHNDGGIDVDMFGRPVLNSDKEVEGDEVGVLIDGKRYIFSKKLFI